MWMSHFPCPVVDFFHYFLIVFYIRSSLCTDVIFLERRAIYLGRAHLLRRCRDLMHIAFNRPNVDGNWLPQQARLPAFSITECSVIMWR